MKKNTVKTPSLNMKLLTYTHSKKFTMSSLRLEERGYIAYASTKGETTRCRNINESKKQPL